MENQKQITVLYVDDEDINLFIFKQSFQDKYNIITANSGAEGLDRLEQYASDIIVVISDMRMPNMNGVEFISKARERFKNIAYYILTGFDYNDEIDAAIENKLINKFFTKPLDIEEIQAAITEGIQDLMND